MGVLKRVREILPDVGSVERSTVEARKIDGGIEIDYGKMYDAPTLGFEALSALSELFGTKSIDVDNYANGGCETCDYGSRYGHTIQVRNPTKNHELLLAEIEKESR